MELVPLEVANKKEPSLYLFKHKDIDGLQRPLKGSSRVKYISFNVSSNYIALGTNAGGIHIFRRSSFRHYRFLNAKVFPQPDSSRIVDVGVTSVLFSAEEKCLAAALSSGHVAIWELNFDKREASQLVKKTDDHKGSTVTSLCWNTSSSKLFIGDCKGCVSGLEVGKIRRAHTIIKEGPEIAQLDFADEKLLISTTKRCVYYHQDNLTQIGTKARDGQYGACFLHQTNNPAVIYCARPGARLWEVDSSGQVLSTQQYKKLLATTSTPIVGHVSGNEKDIAYSCDTYNFPKLLVIRDQYLMTWSKESLIIIDPIFGSLVLWNNQLKDVEDICCNRQDMFVFQTGGFLTRYSLIPPKECTAKLFVMGDWLQCAKVLIACKSQIIPAAARDHVPEYVIRRVREMLNDNLQHERIVTELSELEQNLERVPIDPSNDDIEVIGALSFDDSESRSIASDFISNPDSDSARSTPVLESGMEDVEEKSDKKPKLTKLKNVFKDQLKEISLDTVLLAGAQAAGNMSLPNAFAISGGVNIKPFSPSWDLKDSKYNARSPSSTEGLVYKTPSDDPSSPASYSTSENISSLEDVDSDTEERKPPVVIREMKKKIKIHTVDIVSPLQPTDLIKMEKTKKVHKEGTEKNIDPPKTNSSEITETINENADLAPNPNSSVPHESKESSRSLSVAAKQEVVQKARKFLKRLTPEEKDMGTDQALHSKGSGSKGNSANITSPLEVKSLVIISRETRKKIRENQKLYNPRALRSVLCEWLTYLEKVNIAIELVYPKNKDKREYYVTDVGKVLSPSVKVDLTRFLDPDDTTTVSELATMCFKMKIFSSEDYTKEEDLTSEPLLKCDSCKQKQNGVVFNMDFVQIDNEMQSGEAIKRNFAKTKFLCANFQLLDYQALKAAVIADCLNHQDLLKNLLRCLDDFTERDAVDDAIETGDTKAALQLIKDKAKNYQKRFLRHIFRLYYLIPRDVAKLCAEIYPHLHPWEVVIICLSNSTNLYNNCSDFLIYITHLIQNHAKKSENKLDVLSEMVHSDDFIILVYHSALILDDLADSDVRCQCGWPRPGSHQTSFQYEELMIEIIKHFKSNNDNESLKKLLKISYNHGYWLGCIQLLVMLGLRTEALKLSLQLGDTSLLNSFQIWGWLPQSVSEWKFGLEYLATFHFNTKCKRDEENSGETGKNVVKNPNKNEFPVKDNCDKNAHEVHEEKIGGVSVKNEEDIKGKPEKECLSRPDLTHHIECQKKLSEESKFGTPIISEETCYSFEQHTCMKSTAISGHGSLHIDIKSYVLIMLQKLGAQQTVKIILATHLENVFFTQEFYYKCILSSQAEHHQSPLSHRILRETNDYMWSSKSTALIPEIYQMKELEISSSNKEELFDRRAPLKFMRNLEDAACNWGIDLPLAVSSCCLCPLPLCEKLPGHSEGVIIFPCGHLYHKECNWENYCLFCFYSE